MQPATPARATAARRRDRRAWTILLGAATGLVLVSGSGGSAAAQPGPAARVEVVLDTMSAEQRVGQLFLVPFDGDDVGPGSQVAELITSQRVGGVILEPRRGNFTNAADAPTQVATLSNALQSLAEEAPGTYVPLWVALHQLGDAYPGATLYGGMTPLPSAMSLGATWDPAHAERVGQVVGRELAAVGVNLLLGPSLDVVAVPRPGGSGDLGTRSFGGSPAWVARQGQRFIQGVHLGSAGRVATAAASFPGSGGADRSPVDEGAVVERSLAELAGEELVPFVAVADGAGQAESVSDAFVSSLVRYRAIQQQADRPLALDSGGLRYLWGQVGALDAWRRDGGLVLSPGLGLPAVRRYSDPGGTAFNIRRVIGEALAAGNDLLVLDRFGPPDDPENGLANIEAGIAWLRDRYAEDESVREAVDAAVRRILARKLHLYDGADLSGVLVDATAAAGAAGVGGDAVTAVAQAALTALATPGGAIGGHLFPSPQPGERVLWVVDARAVAECDGCPPRARLDPADLVERVRGLYGPEGTGRLRRAEDVAAITFTELKAWLQARGSVSAEDTTVLVAPLSPERRAEVERQVGLADWLVFAMLDLRPVEAPASDALKLFLRAGPSGRSGQRLAVIGFGAPYYLDTTEIARLSAYYVAYAASGPFLDVGVRALFGDAPPAGSSPVSVPGVGYDLTTRLSPAPAQRVTLELVGHDLTRPVREGETVTVRSSVVLDGNGHAAPDGTGVTLRRYDQAEDVFLPDISATTRDGRVTEVVRADRDGEVVITAVFENGLRSEPLALRVESAGVGGIAGPLLPDVSLPDTIVRPRVPVDWGILLLSLTLTLLAGVLLFGVDAAAQSPTRRARLFLLSLAWGLSGYLLVAAGGLQIGRLPGGLRLWPAGWPVAYQAAVLSFLLALLPVAPSLARGVRASRRERRA